MHLVPGDHILYIPGGTTTSQDYGPSVEIPYGSSGIFIRMGWNHKQFVKGCEPIEVLLHGKIERIYMDEIKKVNP